MSPPNLSLTGVKYVCLPAYKCNCRPQNKPVSLSTMRNHRRFANQQRSAQGLGDLPWGPKLSDASRSFLQVAATSSSESQSRDFSWPESDNADVEDVLEADELERNSPLEDGVGMEVEISPGEMDLIFPPDDNGDGDLQHWGQDVDHTFEQASVLPAVLVSPSLAVNECDSSSSRSSDTHMGMAIMDLPSTALSRTAYFEQWAVENKPLMSWYHKHALEYTVMNDLLRMDIVRCPYKTWESVVSNICKRSGLDKCVQRYPVCPGHHCFADVFGVSEEAQRYFCTECGAGRPTNLQAAQETFCYLPLIPRIQRLVKDRESCEQLYNYRHSRCAKDGVLSDIFDGAAYKRVCERFGGEVGTEFDVFISVSTDGFQTFKNKTYDVWPIVALIHNLAPDQRFLVKNTLPLAFIPGPSEPKDLESFLVPLFNELCENLATDGTLIQFHDGVERKVRIHLLWMSGDFPAISKVAGVKGQNGKSPCRFCRVVGVWSDVNRHYYFPSMLRNDDEGDFAVIYDPELLEGRELQQTYEVFDDLEDCSGGEQDSLKRDTGIQRRCVLFGLPLFQPYISFPLDPMHEFTNVSNQMIRLWTGDLISSAPFVITSEGLRKIDEELRSLNATVSGQLASKPKELSRFRSWKAADHKTFALSYSLVVLDGHLSEPFLTGWRYFVELFELCSQPSLNSNDLERVSSLSISFVKHYEKDYFEFRRDRLHLCKSVIHYLLHLRDSIVECGSLPAASQYPIERYIGWIQNRLNARVLAAESLLRNALFGEAFRIFYKEPFFNKNTEYDDLVCNGGYKTLGRSSLHNLSGVDLEDKRLRKQIQNYLVRKNPGLSASSAKELASSVGECYFWDRFRFVCGCDTQTVRISGTSEHCTSLNRRSSHYVACEMDEGQGKADVYYGRVKKIVGFSLDMGPGISSMRKDYVVVVIEWASGISIGKHGQAYKDCGLDHAFSSTTVEDASVINRLIGIAEHAYPTRMPGSTSTHHVADGRQRKRVYFLDDRMRSDFLLDPSRLSSDGVNRRLCGRLRQR